MKKILSICLLVASSISIHAQTKVPFGPPAPKRSITWVDLSLDSLDLSVRTIDAVSMHELAVCACGQNALFSPTSSSMSIDMLYQQTFSGTVVAAATLLTTHHHRKWGRFLLITDIGLSVGVDVVNFRNTHQFGVVPVIH